MQVDPHELVHEFHIKYKMPVGTSPLSLGVLDYSSGRNRLKLRLDLIREELKELEEASEINDLIGEVDALGDLVYVVYGMAIEMGVNLGPVLLEIQRSNMSKLGPNGEPIYRDDGKVLKGPDFVEPDLMLVLRRQGY